MEQNTQKKVFLVNQNESIIKLYENTQNESTTQIYLTNKRIYYYTELGEELNNQIIELESIDSTKINQIEEKKFAKGFFFFALLMLIIGGIITSVNYIGLVLLGVGVFFFIITMALSRSNFTIALTIIAHGATHNIPINFLTPHESKELQQMIFQTKENNKI
ncbi:MAG: hypothetical protein HFE36_04995 [Clostridia bacterium]|nr:hypothetical protein [Clostridia bacterium]